MKTIIGLIVLTFVVSVTKAQSLNEKLLGAWIVTTDTIGYHASQSTDALQRKIAFKNPNNPGDAQAQRITIDPKKMPPENDVWKFSNDTLYYAPDPKKLSPTRHCTYTIKDSTIFCYGQPAYKILLLNNTELVLKNDDNASDAAGLYILPNSAMVLYLKRTVK